MSWSRWWVLCLVWGCSGESPSAQPPSPAVQAPSARTQSSQRRRATRPLEVWKDPRRRPFAADATAPLSWGDHNRETAIVLTADRRIAYTGGERLVVHDLSAPHAPIEIASYLDYDLWRINALVLSPDETILAVCGRNGLQLMDVTDPRNPTVLSAPTLRREWTTGVRFSADGRWLYAASEGGGGLEVFDISDPSAPMHVAFEYDRHTEDLELSADERHVFLADTYENGLLIFDVSAPATPALVRRFGLPTSRLARHPSGTVLAAAGRGRLTLLDVEDPAAPRILSSLPQQVTEMAFSGTTLIVAEPTGGLRRYDLRDLRAPRLIGGAATEAPVVAFAALDDQRLVTVSHYEAVRAIIGLDASPTLRPLPSPRGAARYELRWSQARGIRLAGHMTTGSLRILQADMLAQRAVIEWAGTAAGELAIAVGDGAAYGVAHVERAAVGQGMTRVWSSTMPVDWKSME